MNDGLKAYYENRQKPWGVMFYRLVWEQLPQASGLRILDFGSGFGITADHFAKNNDVTAIEPNVDMVEMRICENSYRQIIGGIEQLRQQPDNSFDLVLCHNVLEYAKEREDILRELYRVLKPDGTISIIKHNHAGRIMSKVVFENNLDDAIRLLDGGTSNATCFGEINYYDIDDLVEWISDSMIKIEKVLGIRSFFGLQPNNEIKYDPAWQEKMFEIEMKASEKSEFINISFYNHVLLKKVPPDTV